MESNSFLKVSKTFFIYEYFFVNGFILAIAVAVMGHRRIPFRIIGFKPIKIFKLIKISQRLQRKALVVEVVKMLSNADSKVSSCPLIIFFVSHHLKRVEV